MYKDFKEENLLIQERIKKNNSEKEKCYSCKKEIEEYFEKNYCPNCLTEVR